MYYIKIVPEDDINVNGEWHPIPERAVHDLPEARHLGKYGWRDTEDILSPLVPHGHRLVAIRREDGDAGI